MNSVCCAQLFWPFSLQVYGRPGVAVACLALQDDLGLDVNVLLLGLLAALVKRRALRPAEIAGADDHIQHWRRQVVHPLRRLRRQLKPGIAPVPVAQSASLREQIKKLELEAEYLQQSVLAQWLDTLPPHTGEREADAGPDLTFVAAEIVHYYHHHPEKAGERRLSAAQIADYAEQVALAARDYGNSLGPNKIGTN